MKVIRSKDSLHLSRLASGRKDSSGSKSVMLSSHSVTTRGGLRPAAVSMWQTTWAGTRESVPSLHGREGSEECAVVVPRHHGES